MNFNFPRCIVENFNYKVAEMHVFADSSMEAYAVDGFVALCQKIQRFQLVFYSTNV